MASSINRLAIILALLTGYVDAVRDAQVFISNGFATDEHEFFGRPPISPGAIEGSGEWAQEEKTIQDGENQARSKIQIMKLGPDRQYLCLIPAPSVELRIEYEEPQPVDPMKTWALLQPLTGTCLYHRQGWFTYAYCHNQYVRQFRELEHTHPHPPGGRVPKEDPEYQAYTLGRSPSSPTSQSETDLSAAEDKRSQMRDLQLSQGSGQRYLTARWSDGTTCDKTGKKRDIEIQFHCGMTSTDTILFLKETSVCRYLLVLHTPRLCGEPGFQSARQLQPAKPIHCRHILDSTEAASLVYNDPQTRFPYTDIRERNPIHIPDYALQNEKRLKAKAAGATIPTGKVTGKHAEALKKAISQLFGTGGREGKKGGKAGDDDKVAATTIAVEGDDGEEMVLEVLDIDEAGEENARDGGDLYKRIQAALDSALAKTAKRQAEIEKELKADDGWYRDEDDEELYYDDSL